MVSPAGRLLRQCGPLPRGEWGGSPGVFSFIDVFPFHMLLYAMSGVTHILVKSYPRSNSQKPISDQKGKIHTLVHTINAWEWYPWGSTNTKYGWYIPHLPHHMAIWWSRSPSHSDAEIQNYKSTVPRGSSGTHPNNVWVAEFLQQFNLPQSRPINAWTKPWHRVNMLLSNGWRFLQLPAEHNNTVLVLTELTYHLWLHFSALILSAERKHRSELKSSCIVNTLELSYLLHGNNCVSFLVFRLVNCSKLNKKSSLASVCTTEVKSTLHYVKVPVLRQETRSSYIFWNDLPLWPPSWMDNDGSLGPT